jgi:hypothetical protein
MPDIIGKHIPLNSLARWGVFHLSSDKDARVPSSEAQGFFGERMFLMRRNYIVFFPRWLKWFRAIESAVHSWHLGAQCAMVVERWS